MPLAHELRVRLHPDAGSEDDMKKMLKQFIADESGATAIEYGLIAAGLALAIVPALNGVGTSLKGKFTTVSTALK